MCGEANDRSEQRVMSHRRSSRGRSRAPPNRWVPPRAGRSDAAANSVRRPRIGSARPHITDGSPAAEHLHAGVASTSFLRSLLKPNPPALFARDCAGDWLRATVVSADAHRDRVLVHFKGWNSRYDEWFSAAELQTRAKPIQRASNTRLRSKPTRWVPPSSNNLGDVKAKVVAWRFKVAEKDIQFRALFDGKEVKHEVLGDTDDDAGPSNNALRL